MCGSNASSWHVDGGHSQRSGCAELGPRPPGPGPRSPGPRLSATQTPNCQFFSKAPIEVRNYKERDVVAASKHCEPSLCDSCAMEYIIIFYLYGLQFGYNSWYVFEYLVVQKHCIYSFTH